MTRRQMPYSAHMLWLIVVLTISFFLVAAIICVSVSFAQSQKTERFELTSGETVEGEVAFDFDSYFRIQLKDGRERVIYKKDLARQTPSGGEDNESIEAGSRDHVKETWPRPEFGNSNFFGAQSASSGMPMGFVDDPEALMAKLKELAPAMIGIGVGVMLVFLLIFTLFWALIVKGVVRLIGGFATYGQCVTFMLKLAFVTLLINILGAACLFAITKYLMPAGGGMVVIAILALGIGMLALSVMAYIRFAIDDLNLKAGQAWLLFIIMLVLTMVIPIVLSTIGGALSFIPGLG